MVSERVNIAERTIDFSLRIIKLYRELQKDSVGRIIGNQLLRAATSIGANVHEAQGGQSKADFVAKMSITHKEAYETQYWLRLVTEDKLIPEEKIYSLRDESRQIVKILSSILITSKQNT